MNIKSLLYALVIAGLFFYSIWTVAMEMGSLSQYQNTGRLLLMLFIPALFITVIAYKFIKKGVEGLDVWRFTGISFLFFLVIFEAIGLKVNQMTSTNCTEEEVTVEYYKGKYVSGYGRIRAEVKPNKWEIAVRYDNGSTEIYTLNDDVIGSEPTTNKVRLETCKSIFGLKKFNRIIPVD